MVEWTAARRLNHLLRAAKNGSRVAELIRPDRSLTTRASRKTPTSPLSQRIAPHFLSSGIGPIKVHKWRLGLAFDAAAQSSKLEIRLSLPARSTGDAGVVSSIDAENLALSPTG